MGVIMSARLIAMCVLFWCCAAHADEPPPEVQKAIDRAVFALRPMQFGDGSWGEYGPGSTALAILALLEAGVPTTDSIIPKAADFIRYESLRSRHTYSIALSIMALDRLGDKKDWLLVRVLGARLVAGQQEDGGWSYLCPLGELGDLEKTIPAPVGATAPFRRDPTHTENTLSDNSNTQFAILALWIGHRYDVDIEVALRKAGKRLRATALVAGPGQIGWGYTQLDTKPTGARSCCGLLGIAVYHGAEIRRKMKSAPDDKAESDRPRPLPPPADPLKDQLVQDAFRYVTAQFIAETKKMPEPHDHCDYYFLWSYERVAVAYGLEKTYGADWYRLGVRRILSLQNERGLWPGYFNYETETCFCLLFLCRSNLTRDLVPLINPTKAAELKTDPSPPAPPPAPPTDLTVPQLIKTFMDAPAEKREKLVKEYQDHKGVNYTDALAKLIPKVDGIWPKSLRDALATRLSRMTVATLRDRLKDADAELRRAAAVAAAMKEDKTLIPNLIAVLDDQDPWVVRAAGVALNRLTGQDFGPPPNATPEQRSKSVADWKEWWSKQPN
jgi:hypothetical protein